VTDGLGAAGSAGHRDPAAGRHLVLVGLMGAGKTTVGRRCAERLARPFVDVDDVVEATAGLTLAEVFASEGESGFRLRERAAVAEVCGREPSVVACGGGAVIDPDSRAALRARGCVVWLLGAPAVLAARVGSGATRPLLADGEAEATLARLAAERAPIYEAAAHARVVTDGRDVDQVADQVLEVFATCDV
jgi:shikimate kinase